MPNCQL